MRGANVRRQRGRQTQLEEQSVALRILLRHTARHNLNGSHGSAHSALLPPLPTLPTLSLVALHLWDSLRGSPWLSLPTLAE